MSGAPDGHGAVGVVLEVGLALAGAAIAMSGVKAVVARRRRRDLEAQETSLLAGQVVLVTGGSSGIGQAAAQQLAHKGATVVLACRCVAKGAATADKLNSSLPPLTKARPQGRVEVFPVPLELGDVQSVSAFATAYKQAQRPLHALVNNAGAQFATPSKTLLGDETMAVNHVGPWLLTKLLLPTLQDTAAKTGHPSRVLFVSSRLERRPSSAPLLQHWIQDASLSAAPWSTFGVYGASKLANLLTVTHYRHSVAPTQVVFTALTPGMVNTDLGRWCPVVVWWLTWPLRRLLLKSPQQGARPITHLLLQSSPALPPPHWGPFYGLHARGGWSGKPTGPHYTGCGCSCCVGFKDVVGSVEASGASADKALAAALDTFTQTLVDTALRATDTQPTAHQGH